MVKDSLGDRMKHNYEEVTKTRLTSRMPIIIRLDGCHFHTFTKGMVKPFDSILIKTMQDTMKYLCENIQGCVLGYTQSDEITLVLVDYKELNTSPWFDNELLKMTSVSASLATLAFNKFYYENIADMAESEEDFKKYAKKLNQAYFDSRAFNIPKEEVCNCVFWRQLDAERNSILSLGQAYFPHKQLQNKSCKDIVTMLEQDKGIIWGELPTTLKRGSCCIKSYLIKDKRVIAQTGGYWIDEQGNCYYDVQADLKSQWIIDNDIPKFKDEGRDYIEKLVYVGD